ncbi:hypothetical protein HNR30_009192 [Nonomuraea soli]|uniref:DUF4158 domain-containing protein n=1 Tax=Nonomuraea soli TaxID=1032476 RepID=A0A7W0CUX1_9ACTN|nr:hypothetical protein [Nonomuraea soli]
MEKFFFLDAFDREVIARSRQNSHRLGVAVQIGTVRHKGLFLEDPLEVPWPVVDYLAEQLGIGDPSQVKRYGERSKTAYEHAWMIRDVYGFHDFDDREVVGGPGVVEAVLDVPARSRVDACRGADGVVRSVGGMAAPASGAAAGGDGAGAAGRLSAGAG